MVRLLCLDTLHNAALSKPTDASAHKTKMFDRVPPVDYVEGNEGTTFDRGGPQLTET
jgi:hypothetical protein